MTSTPPTGEKQEFNRSGLESLLTRRFFISPAFDIYNGVAGLYDYGPNGCAIKANLINFWRQHFVLNEDMLEVDCTSVTPEQVLVASGHVAKFSDNMVRDEVSKQYLRADHLLEDHIKKLLKDPKNTKEKIAEYEHVLAKAGDYPLKQLQETLNKYAVKSPEGNPISEAKPFNLMFKTQIGPSEGSVGYLRPETAQGIFVNFAKLLEYNGSKLPFAAAQIGNAFRNEIAPRSGLLRVREFTMAEIEHFVNPLDKSHSKFSEVADQLVNLLSAEAQDGDKKIIVMTFGEAVKSGLINNETLAYFMARTQSFLHTIGIKPNHLRFRQHQANEMAHYASDCWDAEIRSSFGWVECVGHADRSCFDLTSHAKASKKPLEVFEPFKNNEKKVIDIIKVDVNRGVLGKTFKGSAGEVSEYLKTVGENHELAYNFQKDLEAKGSVVIAVNGNEYIITKDMVTFKQDKKTISGSTYVPHVIEPSFGLGRIIYSLLEHSYWTREGDANRGVLSLPPIIAPVKASVLPLVNNEKLLPFIQQINKSLKEQGISSKVDDTGVAIGRKYARTDEIGIPFAITIDFQTVDDQTVTLRERDTTKQIRIPITELSLTIKKLCDHLIYWSDVVAKYPAYEPQAESK
ncbi:glycyl-tRNA synthetase [Tieghemostelium lacteum]|uniref:glycine--tRNA ligase n=1 Tax=Tieghemostelium lacteum TaxID=361077 RepID=A0A151ZSW8_TIELA|nr:glycyl-tRNA synthetase [Tieghemostelium lacteum]|eukprot:KYQ96874.1 glycyl-tRNA synthetase [Tieghemostelium lacteum]